MEAINKNHNRRRQVHLIFSVGTYKVKDYGEQICGIIKNNKK